MRAGLVAIAAAAATITLPTPALAFDPPASPFAVDAGFAAKSSHAAPGVRIHRGDGSGDWDGRRHGRRGRDGFVVGSWYGPVDFDGNRAFDPDKYNDWWHERPHRAYPRWVFNNEGCHRMWQEGGSWRC